ncbi:hypothetical protein BGLT_00774 [Caballeronia glathei]|jgi:hypothetical protein|uniref:DUF4148 domain-containing protein n=1 Tax=Caballeronia glathei TaxID=60547 RepID=UPI00050422A2|nr:DUF4148 domain-containing protein [Caballeronia glathei]CDY76905.1 hypothetical protein BGLT_00774 [Caballeronia glathei]
MKTLVYIALAVGALAGPALSFADTANDALTRAQVRADLVRAEHAGYRPIGEDASYPADIQSVDARIAAQDDQRATSALGGAQENGASQSGGAPARQ